MKDVGANIGAILHRLRGRQGGSTAAPENAENAHTGAILTATLTRFESTETHTLGELIFGGEKFYIIERPWRNNLPNVSCIPCGIYRATYMARSSSGKYRNVHWLRNVPNRSGVLQHNGNKASHSRGCLIIGLRIGYLGGDRAVLNSRTALARFEEIAEKKPVDFQIQMAA